MIRTQAEKNQGYIDIAKQRAFHGRNHLAGSAADLLSCTQCPRKPGDLDCRTAYRTDCLISSVPRESGDLDCLLLTLPVGQVPHLSSAHYAPIIFYEFIEEGKEAQKRSRS